MWLLYITYTIIITDCKSDDSKAVKEVPHEDDAVNTRKTGGAAEEAESEGWGDKGQGTKGMVAEEDEDVNGEDVMPIKEHNKELIKSAVAALTDVWKPVEDPDWARSKCNLLTKMLE